MKRFLFYPLLLSGLLALFVACTEDEPQTQTEQPYTDPELTLEQQELTVPAEGGRFTVNYTLEGAVEGAELKVSVQHESWVGKVDTSVEGKISFEVKASYEPEARTCRVELIYPGLYPNPELTIRQQEGLEHAFTFDVKQVMSNTIVMDVLPKDKTMPYVFLLGKKNYMVEEDLLDDDAGQVASDMQVFEDFGAAFGGTAQDVITAFMYEGDQIDYAWNGVDRNTEYVAYAYGFDRETMQPTTEVCRVEITTLNVQDYIVNFDLSVEVEGPNVQLRIAPENYDGYYFFDVFAASDCPPGTDENTVRSYCEAAWESVKAIYSPFFETPEQGLHFIFNELAYSGVTEFSAELNAETDYVLWAFAMNNEALMNSTPVMKYFSTGAAKASENTFTITITDVKARQATVAVEPSNDDPYVLLIATSDQFAGMSDEQIMDEVCANWDYSEKRGAYTTKVEGLIPATDYEFMAFGINGGRPSTGLTRESFTTGEAVSSTARFELYYDKFYDLEEVAALDPAWEVYKGYDLLLPVEALVDDQVKYVYYEVLDAENYNFYTPTALREVLLSNGPSDLGSIYLLNYDLPFVFFGFAEDQDGNFTDFWASSEIIFTYEDRSPASEIAAPAAAKSAVRSCRTKQQLSAAKHNLLNRVDR